MRKIFLIMLIITQFIFAENKLNVVEVQVLNNKEVPVEVIESNMELKIGSVYSAEKMVKDFIKIKTENYIKDLKIYPEIKETGIKLVVTVYEKENVKELLKAKGIIPISEMEKIDKSLTIKEIKITGLQYLKAEDFKEKIPLVVGGYFSKTKALEARNNLLDTGYFYSVEPDAVKFEDGVYLTYKIVENMFVDAIEVEGNNIFKDEELKAIIKSKDKYVFNYNDLRNDKELIDKKYLDAGYGLAGVYDIKIEPENKKIVFYVGEGIVKDIQFRKIIKRENDERRNKEKSDLKTESFVLDREIVVEKGKPFETAKFETTAKNLFRLGFFKNVTPQFESVPGDPNSKIVIFVLDEQKTASYQGTLSYGSAIGFVGSMSVEDNNYRGKGQRLSLAASFGKGDSSKTYELNFTDPWVKDTERFSYGWGVYRKDYTDTDSTNAYNVSEQGFKVNGGKGLTDKLRLRLGTKLVAVTEKNKEKVVKDDYTTISLIPAIIYDTRNNYYSATRGSYASLELELGKVIDRQSYQTLELELRNYHKGLFENNNFAYRGVFGVGSDNLKESQKFKVGGGNTLRGYNHSEFKGNYEAYLNLENRTKLNDNFEAVLFADAGRAWDKTDSSTENLNLGQNIKTSYGVGLRVQTPIGPLRFDYGWPVGQKNNTGGQFYFNIGQLF